MYSQYRKKRKFFKNCIFMVCFIFLILSDFKPEHAEASWLTKFIDDTNEDIVGIFTGGTSDTTNTTADTATPDPTTNTTPPIYTYTQTNTYTNTVNGAVVTSSENKTTRYTVTTMVNGVKQTGTVVDDGIMLKYDDGRGVESYLIPGDGQMLLLQAESGSETAVLAKSPWRGMTLKTNDGTGKYVDVGNDGSLIDPNRQPVVITHGFENPIKDIYNSLFGYSSGYEDMLALGAKYDPVKYQVFYADYGSTRGIDDISKDLADKVNNNVLQFYSGKAPIIFEQHSMGCAVVYYALANGLVDMSKIDTVLMISLAPLYDSAGFREDANFLISYYSEALAQGNTAAFFADMKRKGLPSNVKHIVIGTIDDGTNSMGQQLNLGYDGLFTISNIDHVGILTDEAVDRIIDLYIDYEGTFIRKIGNWNMAYQHGRLTALYYNNFDGPGNGLALLTDDTGNLTGQFGTYTGSYIEGNANELIIVNGDYSQRTDLADGSWDEETMFGTQHFNSEGINTGYTITTGMDAPIYVELEGTLHNATVVSRALPSYGTTPVNSSSDTTPPTAPGAPTASSPNDGTFTLTWTASTDANGIDKYLVYRGRATGSKSLIATVTTNSYNESDLPDGKYLYSVTAVDKAGWNSNSPDSAVIEVVKVNRRPVLATIGWKVAYVGNSLTFTVSATDPDGDPKWYRATGLPAGATFSNRTFSWTPTLSQVDNYSVTFFVTDGLSSDSETVLIKVRVNQPPVLNAIGNKGVNEGVNLNFRVLATDPYGDTLTYRATGLPQGASFSGHTLNWTPTFSQTGSYNVTFTVSDGTFTDSETIMITVANVNRPPVMAPIGSKSVNEGANLAFTVSATDPDGDTLTYSATGLPAGATFNASTRAFNWTPTYSQSVSYSVTFKAADSGGLSASATAAIIVGNVPVPDLITSSLSTAMTGVVVAPGDSFSMRNIVRNQGMAAAGSFTVAFSLSKDANYGGTDDIAFTQARTVSGLNVGADSFDATSLTVLTTTPGSYYVCARVDSGNTVTELDEVNNSRCTSSTIQVVSPDLVMTQISGPASASAGTTVSVINTVQNQGAGNADSFSVGFYLSTDATITVTDTLVGTQSFGGLGSGVSNSNAPHLTIPVTLAAGTYYIGAIADYNSRLAETSETNNTRAGNPIQVVVPDLVMMAVSGPTSGVKGTNINIGNAVKNQGVGSAGSFTVGLYLSTDANITTADLRIGTRSVSSLAAGVSSSATTGVMIPTTIATGTYYIGAIADFNSILAETNETNNTRAGNTIVVQ